MKTVVIPRNQTLPPPKRGVQYVYANEPKRHGKGSYKPTVKSGGYRLSCTDNLMKVQTHRPPFSFDPAAQDSLEGNQRLFFYSPNKVKAKIARQDGEPRGKRRSLTVEKVPEDLPMPKKGKKGAIYVR